MALQQSPSPSDAPGTEDATVFGRIPATTPPPGPEPTDSGLEDLLRLAAQWVGCPIARIAVEEAGQITTLVGLGCDNASPPHDVAICRAVDAAQPLLLLPDAQQDSRFHHAPEVIGSEGVRFYLGIALIGSGGRQLGVLSVADRVAREAPGPEQVAGLQRLARIGARLLEPEVRDRDDLHGQRAQALLNAVIVLDGDGHILSINGPARRLFGQKAASGRPVQALFPLTLQDDPEGTVAWLGDQSGTRAGLDDSRELRLRTPAGRLHTVEAVRCVWQHAGQDAHALVLRDTTEHHRLQQARIPLQDPLTGTHNRATLTTQLDGLLAEGTPFVVALLGLDGFRGVNEALGHSIGDSVLQIVAARLLARMTTASQLARSGGDEFALVFPMASREAIDAEMLSLLRDLARPCQVDHHRIHLEASVGLVAYDPAPQQAATCAAEYVDAGEVLARAGLAMRRAKRAGGKHSRWFEPLMRTEAIDRRKLELELRRACLNDEFELHYQPQIDLASGEATGAEALLRWRHPERGLLFPVAFIEALSHSAVAPEVGRWVLQRACRDASGWPVANGRRLAVGVNLFPVQLDDLHLLGEVDRALAESGLDPSQLELELTETIALRSDGVTEQLLAQLRSRGVRVSFDDFGTGYASLSMLQRLPVDRVKIDRSFVQNVNDSRGNEAIVRSIALIARNFDLDVIAEGVETDLQASLLREIGCDQVQGFLYSRALPADDFGRWLAEQPAGEGND